MKTDSHLDIPRVSVNIFNLKMKIQIDIHHHQCYLNCCSIKQEIDYYNTEQ
ncbi:hypothetical protein Hanom_Chr03g00204521 [Helianthus anomalus]